MTTATLKLLYAHHY